MNLAEKFCSRERHPGQFGEKNGMSKITKEIVLEIRSLYASKEFSQSEIGNKFGLSQSHVGCIVRGKKWGVL